MKRIALALTLALAGGACFFALDTVAHRAGQRLRASQSEWDGRTQRLVAMEAEKAALTTKVRTLQLDLHRHGEPEVPELAGLPGTNGLISLKPEALEKLRAELGLSWHSSDEWILLSKATLATVRMDALKGSKLADPACGALAITVDERRSLDDAFAGVREEFANWAKASMQREGTNGERLVSFTIPPNLELATVLSNKLAASVTSALGQQRAELLQRYSRDWNQLEVGGLATMTNTLTISRRTNSDGAPRLYYDFNAQDMTSQTRRGQSGQIIPGSRYFPSSFQGVFPGGWREVAEREGFELPSEFPNGAK